MGAKADGTSMSLAVEFPEMSAAVSTSGSQDHALGKCTPCAYFWYKKDGCRKGEECEFCHLCQKGEIKKRKKHRVQQLKDNGEYIPGYSKLQRASSERGQIAPTLRISS